MIQFTFHLLSFILFSYLAITTSYLLVMALAGKFAMNAPFQMTATKRRIIVLIPSYKEDDIIIDTAVKCARQDYPSSFFQILVIADSLKKNTLEKLRAIPVNVLEVKFDISTKARSLSAALESVKNDHFEIAVILDADNIMEDSCLEQINNAFNNNHKAIQCHRSAKNHNTIVAQLDAISEEININLFRRGPAVLGLSAMPLGSGMAFDFTLLLDIFGTPGIVDNVAEDREIEIQLMKRKIKMIFLNNAIVYDEKVKGSGVFQKQRTRWMEAQLNQIRRFFKPDLSGISKTPDYFIIFFQSLLLPRLLYLLTCCIVLTVILFQWAYDSSFIYPLPGYWICWMITYFIVLLVSIPYRYFTLKTLVAIRYIPVLMISMLKAIFKLKRNRKEFLHTSKTFDTDNDV